MSSAAKRTFMRGGALAWAAAIVLAGCDFSGWPTRTSPTPSPLLPRSISILGSFTKIRTFEVSGRDVIEGFGYMGVDITGDNAIECDVRGQWQAMRSGT